MDTKKKTTYWRWSCAAVIALCILTFTPVIIPAGVYKPTVWGIPYSLWTSFLITIALVALTFVGTRVHPGMKDEEDRR